MRRLVIEVSGDVGSGKSTVIEKIKNALKNEYKISHIDIDRTSYIGFLKAQNENDIVIFEKIKG